MSMFLHHTELPRNPRLIVKSGENNDVVSIPCGARFSFLRQGCLIDKKAQVSSIFDLWLSDRSTIATEQLNAAEEETPPAPCAPPHGATIANQWRRGCFPSRSLCMSAPTSAASRAFTPFSIPPARRASSVASSHKRNSRARDKPSPRFSRPARPLQSAEALVAGPRTKRPIPRRRLRGMPPSSCPGGTCASPSQDRPRRSSARRVVPSLLLGIGSPD